MGYYSPFFPSTIMQEEEQAETGHMFNLAEENFFRHRLQTLYPKIDEEGIKTSIGFLATQKLVNCPCSVHTEERGYEWIVFRRQPDRKIYSTDDDDKEDSTSESTSDDDVFFSAEAEDALLDQRADYTEPSADGERNLKGKILELMSLMEKKIQGPRCQINCVTHPYIPGRKEVKLQHKATSHIRRRRKRNPRTKKKKSNLLALVRAL